MQNLVIRYEDKVALAGSVDCDGRTLEFGEAFPKLVKDVDSEDFDLMLADIINKFVLYTCCQMLPVEDKPKQKTFSDKIDMLVEKFLVPGLLSLLASAAGGEGEKAEAPPPDMSKVMVPIILEDTDFKAVQKLARDNNIGVAEAVNWIVGYFRAGLLVPPAPEAAE